MPTLGYKAATQGLSFSTHSIGRLWAVRLESELFLFDPCDMHIARKLALWIANGNEIWFAFHSVSSCLALPTCMQHHWCETLCIASPFWRSKPPGGSFRLG